MSVETISLILFTKDLENIVLGTYLDDNEWTCRFSQGTCDEYKDTCSNALHAFWCTAGIYLTTSEEEYDKRKADEEQVLFVEEIGSWLFDTHLTYAYKIANDDVVNIYACNLLNLYLFNLGGSHPYVRYRFESCHVVPLEQIDGFLKGRENTICLKNREYEFPCDNDAKILRKIVKDVLHMN